MNSFIFDYNFMPWIWLIVLIICIIVEYFTFSLTTIWAAFSSLILIFVSKTNLPLKWQFLIFVLLNLFFLFITRPIVLKYVKNNKSKKINSLIDQEVLVIKEIKPFEKGEAKTSNGVVWNAKVKDNSLIEINSICKIIDVEGNTLIIEKQ